MMSPFPGESHDRNMDAEILSEWVELRWIKNFSENRNYRPGQNSSFDRFCEYSVECRLGKCRDVGSFHQIV